MWLCLNKFLIYFSFCSVFIQSLWGTGPLERRVCLQLLRLVCKAGYSTWSMQAFYRLGEERHEKIAYRDELGILNINFRLFAHTESRYFRPCTGQNLILTISITGSRDSAGCTVTRLQAGYPRNRGSIPSRTYNLCLLRSVQTGSGAHPDVCSMGAVGAYPGGKADGA